MCSQERSSKDNIPGDETGQRGEPLWGNWERFKSWRGNSSGLHPGGGGQLREKSYGPIEVALLGSDQVYKAVWRFGEIRRHRDDFNPNRKIPCPTPAGSFVRAD